MIEISELDLFKLCFDAEVDEMFLDSSMRYAKQKNDQTFEMDQTDLWDVVTIMNVSPYMSDHSLACIGPLMKMYHVLLLEN